MLQLPYTNIMESKHFINVRIEHLQTLSLIIIQSFVKSSNIDNLASRYSWNKNIGNASLNWSYQCIGPLWLIMCTYCTSLSSVIIIINPTQWSSSLHLLYGKYRQFRCWLILKVWLDNNWDVPCDELHNPGKFQHCANWFSYCTERNGKEWLPEMCETKQHGLQNG